MKHLKLILLLLMIKAMSIAQPNTGQRWYNHGSLSPILSSGTYVSTDPGFVMAGYRPSIASGSNFIIDKVDMDGLFNSSTGEFSRQYTITTGGNNCNVSVNPAANCYGVSIIETFQGADQYAIAASFDEGLIIAFLNSAGVVTTSTFYPFPSGAVFPSKPLITESALNPGNYYIVGSFQNNSRTNLFAIKTDVNFTTGWSNLYDCGSGTIFLPNGIVESVFSTATGELIVAGEYSSGGGASDGFVIAIDDVSSGGTINYSNRYHSSATPASTEYFSSLQLANDNSGYILGGWSNATANANRAWMARLTSSGGYSWSSLIEFTNDGSAGNVVGVQERYNTSNAYEYYGLSKSSGAGTNGMLVCKLDNSGAAFGTADEFYYSAASIGESVAISHNNTVSDPNEGLHVFGNRTTSPEEFYLVQACFNGASGDVSATYQDVTTLNSTSGGPNQLTSLNVNINSGLTPCSYYGIASSSVNVSIAQPTGYLAGTAWPSVTFIGNNNKSIVTTGFNEGSKSSKSSFIIFPNPVAGRLKLELVGLTESDFTVEILNVQGRSVYFNKYSLSNSLLIELEVKELNLPDGIYLTKITSATKVFVGNFIVRQE